MHCALRTVHTIHTSQDLRYGVFQGSMDTVVTQSLNHPIIWSAASLISLIRIISGHDFILTFIWKQLLSLFNAKECIFRDYIDITDRIYVLV